MNTTDGLKNKLLGQHKLHPKMQIEDLVTITHQIDTLLKTKKSISIAIDGNCGSGKTTLAKIISAIFECNVFHMDDFFLTPDLRTEERLSEVGGNVDYVRFYKEVIMGIDSHETFEFQKFNCQIFELDEIVSIKPHQLNIIEGSYSMHPTLIHHYDLKIFLSIDKDKQIERISERNGPFMLQKFIHEWIPKENLYFEKMAIRNKANLVFDV